MRTTVTRKFWREIGMRPSKRLTPHRERPGMTLPPDARRVDISHVKVISAPLREGREAVGVPPDAR